jgi:hypothetical protein
VRGGETLFPVHAQLTSSEVEFVERIPEGGGRGLIDNIGFLYRVMCELKSKGYDVVVVGKAFDDDLYVYFVDRVGEEKIVYNGLNVKVIGGFNNIDCFERANWYMQSVDEEVIVEAVGEVEKNVEMSRVEYSEKSPEPDGRYYCGLRDRGIFKESNIW